jgi:hypothetical protein
LSHFSQLGLFLFTGGAFYFTVLPLYQKALLDEAIARKEVELKQATQALEKSYSGLRASVIREYVFFSGAECSNLLGSQAGKSNSDDRKMTVAEEIFAIDVPLCMQEMLQARKIEKELRAPDYAFLTAHINELNARLSIKRQEAMTDHDRIPGRARSNPELIPPPGGLIGEYLKIEEDRIEAEAKYHADLNSAIVHGRKLEKLEPEISLEKRKLKYSVLEEQNRIAREYAEAIRNEISTLNDLKSPSLNNNIPG